MSSISPYKILILWSIYRHNLFLPFHSFCITRSSGFYHSLYYCLVLTTMATSALLDRILFNSWLRVVWLDDSVDWSAVVRLLHPRMRPLSGTLLRPKMSSTWTVSRLHSTDFIVVSDDFNTKIGHFPEANWRNRGSFSVPIDRNENGDHFIETIVDEHRLLSNMTSAPHVPSCASTAFDWDWPSCYWSTTVDSDSALLRARLCLCLVRDSTNKKTTSLDDNRRYEPQSKLFRWLSSHANASNQRKH